jgi:hypothetical protein
LQITEAQKLPEEGTVWSPARVAHAPPRTSPAAVGYPINTKTPQNPAGRKSVALPRASRPWRVKTTFRAWRLKHRRSLRKRLHKRTANTTEQDVTQGLRRNELDLAWQKTGNTCKKTALAFRSAKKRKEKTKAKQNSIAQMLGETQPPPEQSGGNKISTTLVIGRKTNPTGTTRE